MENNNVIAALFDFDGVVCDTETQYSRFWAEQGDNYNIGIENFSSVIKGSTLRQIFDKYFPGNDALQQRITRDLDIFEENMSFDFIAGIEVFIKELREKGIKTAVVTSSNEKKMALVFKSKPEIKDLFDEILTASMFSHSKPHPDCFLLGARKFQTIPDNCYVFEDSFHGLEAGNRAEMNVIGLATTNSREAITDKANLVIDDFTGFTLEKMLKAKR